MDKQQESLFSKLMTSEQVEALKEEIVVGIKKINGAIESDQRLKMRKESLKKIINNIDVAIESDTTPLFIKIFYKTIKVHLIESIDKIFNDQIKQNDK